MTSIHGLLGDIDDKVADFIDTETHDVVEWWYHHVPHDRDDVVAVVPTRHSSSQYGVQVSAGEGWWISPEDATPHQTAQWAVNMVRSCVKTHRSTAKKS